VPIATYVKVLQGHIASKVVPIVTMFSFPDGTSCSGNQSATELAASATWWAANAATFRAGLGKNWMINIANEWGARGSTAWRDAYIAAIATMRSAGVIETIVIDTGGFGQDLGDLTSYSTAVFNSDPLKNVLFSLHVYNSYNDLPTLNAALTQFNTLSAANGMAFACLEFGPGHGVGVSSALTPDQIIGACEAAGIGWCAWAWDDNNLAGGASNDSGFSMTKAGPGIYNTAADLTTYGTDIVAQLAKLSVKATSF
jgi:hypothetical protein